MHLVYAQVAKVNGERKKNVWEIMEYPEYALKYKKSVHLPTWLYLLDDLAVIWVWFVLEVFWVKSAGYFHPEYS